MEYGIAVLVVGVVAFGFLLLRTVRKLGVYETKLEEKTKEQVLSNENLKKRWKNEAIIKSASDAERDKLLNKWKKRGK